MKEILKKIIPPIFLSVFKAQEKYGFRGEYKNWREAQKDSSGYNDDLILEKTKNVALQVKEGKATFERDSVLFEKPQYAWHLIAALFWIAKQNNQPINILDFGGSLGTTYFQNKKFLSCLNLKWNVVEQKKMVDAGEKLFKNTPLKFYRDIETCVANEGTPDLILLSSSIQYLEKPYELIEKIKTMKTQYLIIDRTPFVEREMDTITVQRVPPKIYDASLPCWLLSLKKFKEKISSHYNLLAEFQQEIDNVRFIGNKKQIYFKGFLFKLK